MNKLTTDKRAMVVRCLIEGCSIRSTVRMTGVAKNTIAKLQIELGNVCRKYQRNTLRLLNCKRVQVDEIWAFCHSKERNVRPENKGVFGHGDIWTWTAIDPDSKLIITWHLGNRDMQDANIFMQDLADRVTNIVQLTSDGLGVYPQAVRNAFGTDVDFATLIKVYRDGNAGTEARYSPGNFVGCQSKRIIGEPDPYHVCTSHVERHNLTIRMSMRRFTRLTNGHSKKWQNHEAALSIFTMYYNFARIHESIRTTPAMEAGVTTKLWEIEDIIGLLDGIDPN